MSLSLPHSIIIYGPTAVGKTAFADQLCTQIPCEIVNMDMGQFYAPLSIGTAKPDLSSTTVPHHLFDVVDTPTNFTVMRYRERLIACMHEIVNRGNIPVLVGGSGFYLRSFLFPPQGAHIEVESLSFVKDEKLWDHLYQIDPERAREIDPQDQYRLKRAIALWQTTGIKPSQLRPVYDPPFPFTLVGLVRNRQDLHARINARVKQMLDEGWVEETERLMGSEWEKFLEQKNVLGYPEIIAYLQGEQGDYELMVHRIQKQTRRYAKRQMTLWRSLEHQVRTHIQERGPAGSQLLSFNLTLGSIDLYIIQLQKTLGL